MTQRRVGESNNFNVQSMQTFNNNTETSTFISEAGLNFIRSCFNAKPTGIKMQLRADNGYLTAKLGYWYSENLTITLSLDLDRDLFFAITEAMNGKSGKLNSYIANKHRMAIIDKSEIEDTYLSVVYQLSNLYKIEIGERFISKSSNVYEHILFRPTANTLIEIFVPVSHGVQTAINKFLNNGSSEKDVLNQPACSTNDYTVYNGMGEIYNL